MIVAPLSASAKKINVAVLDFKFGEGVTKGETDLITARFQSELLTLNTYTLLERSEVDLILKEQGLQNSGACNTTECQVEIGQLLGVDKLVTGMIGNIGELITINIKLVDVETGTIEKSRSRDYPEGLKRLLTVGCKELAYSITSVSNGQLNEAQKRGNTSQENGLNHSHTRTYFSIGMGPEYSNFNDQINEIGIETGSPIAHMELRIGAAVMENLILSFDFFVSVPDGDSIATEATEDIKLAHGLVGGGITYYFMPYNIYAGVTLGLDNVDIGDNREIRKYGSAIAIKTGKEFWISENLAWGLSLKYRYGYTSGVAGIDVETHAISAIISFTYN